MASQNQEDTVFHKIMRKELPATFVYEDDKCFAIKDLYPVAPVHYLIIPRKTIKNLGEMEEADEPIIGHLLYVASKLAKQEKLDEGFRVCLNTNAHACQTVYQLHVHLIGGRQLKLELHATISLESINIKHNPYDCSIPKDSMEGGLRFFILRAESKRLYRRFMNLTRQIEDTKQRESLRLWIRDDFRINKKLTNEDDIKSQHIRGRKAYEELENSIDLSRAKNGSS